MIEPMAVMEDPSILVAMEAERDSLKAALSAARAEVERLSRVEAAAKAWEEWPVSLDSDIPPDVVAMKIRQGILPNGKPVKP
jgi:AmiR/NasT family two-component response regulator